MSFDDDAIEASEYGSSSDGLTGRAVDDSRLIPAIEFCDVDLAFDEQVILEKVCFTVRKGETKIVLGGSGSGKSTIIKLILGLLKPDGGEILIDG